MTTSASPASTTASRPKYQPLSGAQLAIGDLPDRMQAVQPGDTCKGMFFNSILLETERALGPQARAQVQALLPERKYVDFFNYPSLGFLPAAYRVAQLLAPKQGGLEGAFRHLGARAIADFLATPVGSTLLLVSAGNMKRLLQATPTAYKTAVTYGTRETIPRGETGCLFRVKGDLMPAEYHQGVFQEVFRTAGTPVNEVTFEKTGFLDADFTLRWA